MAESGFDTFESDYDKVNRIDSKTWAKRKVYDDRPYLVLPNFKFSLKLGDTGQNFRCFVKKAGEQFGDAIPLPNIADYTIRFKVYDYSNSLQFIGNMAVASSASGEITYEFSPIDFSRSGMYYCDIELTKDGKTFTLPDTQTRYEIIVRD